MDAMEQIIFTIINHGGNAKGLTYEAINLASEGQFEEAERLLKEADHELKLAHKVQTQLIHEEAAGKKHEVSVLFVHAQDHLMTALEVRSLADLFLNTYRRIKNLEGKEEN